MWHGRNINFVLILKLLKRRNLVSEIWLLQQTQRLTRQLQSTYSTAQKEALVLRLVGELAEFMLPRELKAGEDQGRISGNLNWRKERGEVGSDIPAHKPVVWSPTEEEIYNGEFSLEYRSDPTWRLSIEQHNKFLINSHSSASLDQYIRRSDEDKIIKKWSNGVFQAESISYKLERDWNMAYLCRSGT